MLNFLKYPCFFFFIKDLGMSIFANSFKFWPTPKSLNFLWHFLKFKYLILKVMKDQGYKWSFPENVSKKTSHPVNENC
jgi:hypothetical protein